jgi:adenylosuccinate synthase
MKNIAILDTLLGDNAKGHFAHYFSPQFDWVIRTSGSSNCGHVVYRDGKKYVHHLLPSGDYRVKNLKSFLGSGMYINLEELLEEIKLAEQDFPGVAKTIYVDPDAFTINEEHIKFDKEKNKHIGSTAKGVSPAATSKYARTGERVYDYINCNAEVIKTLKALGVHFTPLLSLRETFERSKLLFEGNQGVMLDINSGIYPYVTTSDCTVSGIYASGFHFVKLDRVYGMMKPYLTKSGEGPLPSEYFGKEAEDLRMRGGEFGNTTGRARRVGALDLPMLKYGIRKGGMTHLIISKMDILSGQESVKVCYDYGKEVHSPNDFRGAAAYYTHLPGWKDAKSIKQISPFITHIENYTNTPVEYISAGIDNSDILKSPWVEVEKESTNQEHLLNPFDMPEEGGFIKYGDESSNIPENMAAVISIMKKQAAALIK